MAKKKKIDRFQKNQNWLILDEAGEYKKHPRVAYFILAVLQDIRRELRSNNLQVRRLSSLIGCYNCVDIPNKLERIAKGVGQGR